MKLDGKRKLLSMLIRLLSLLFLFSSLFITVGCDTRDWYLYTYDYMEGFSLNRFNITLLPYQLILLLIICYPYVPIWIRLIPVILFYMLGYFFRQTVFCFPVFNTMFYICVGLSIMYTIANVISYSVKASK